MLVQFFIVIVLLLSVSLFEPKDCFTYFTSKCSKLCVNRYSLAKAVVMMWKEMSCLASFMSREKRGQAITIIRRLVP